ncbi:hypothetical protein FHL15_009782 [Xylaria flabelliformis]|uniref:4'-phosphopantetheinyl transferase domain-containing protein n=1 Tax=Xylaria flabelliformis TaxID=2512241 RepID=A0A553HN21_9PEZI|nr:hypothetical protein FHL15_009782 [Xylaria flabelliformis]
MIYAMSHGSDAFSRADSGLILCILEQNAQGNRVAEAHPSSIHETPTFTRAAEFMAGRFAAKEAVIKAHPHRRLTFQCITILRATNSSGDSVPNTSGQGQGEGQGQGQEFTSFRNVDPWPEPKEESSESGPVVALIKADENAQSDIYASVSISHDTDYATAVCLGINPTSQLIWGSTMQNTVTT